MRRAWMVVTAVTMIAGALGACSSDEGPRASAPPEQGGGYVGVLTGANESGVLEATIAGENAVGAHALAIAAIRTVTATLRLAGSTVTLTGTFDPATGAFALTGGGYSLTGSMTTTGIAGTYTGPRGSGSFVLVSGSRGTVSPFCGSFAGDDNGTWNISAVQGGFALGAWADRAGTSGTFAGRWATDSTLTLTGSPVSAMGRLTPTTGSGTWSSPSKRGTWVTDTCAFGGAPEGGAPPSDAAADGDPSTDASLPPADASRGDAASGTDASDAGQAPDGSDAGASTDASDSGTDSAVATDGATDAAPDASTDASSDSGADAATDAAADAGLDYTEIVTDTFICNLATDGTYVYLGYCKNKGIKRIAISAGAGTPTSVVAAASTLNMVVNAGTVYWLDNTNVLLKATASAVSAAGTQIAVSSNITGTGSLNIANGNVYWVDNDNNFTTSSIRAVGVNGGAVTTLVASGPRVSSMGVDAANGFAYYGITGELRRVSLTSGAPTTVRSVTAANVQADGSGFIFWTEGDALWHTGVTNVNVGSLPAMGTLSIWSDFAYYRTTQGSILKGGAFTASVPTPITADVTGTEFVVAPPYVYWRTADGMHLRRAAN